MQVKKSMWADQLGESMLKSIVICIFLFFIKNTHSQELSIYWMAGGALDTSRAKSFHVPDKPPRKLIVDGENKPPESIFDRTEAIAKDKDRVSFMLINNGKIIYQQRHSMVGDHSLIVSYSMAKSITSLLVGHALCAGKINSLDDKLGEYVPELSGTVYGRSTVKNLLNMASGANASGKNGEPYEGYTGDLRNHNVSYINSLIRYQNSAVRFFSEQNPGDYFDYKNVDTASLSILIEKATHRKLQEWYQDTLLASAGLENRTAWSLDSDDRAIAHAYFFASVNDWARIALYTLDAYNGRKGACMADFMKTGMKEAIPIYRNPDFTRYGYQFWTGISRAHNDAFCMLGYGGQYICIDPRKERILIASSKKSDSAVIDLFRQWINE